MPVGNNEFLSNNFKFFSLNRAGTGFDEFELGLETIHLRMS